MKLLLRMDPNAQNRRSRWVFLEGVDEPTNIDEALEHPYKFRLDHLKELELSRETLSPQQMRKFNQMGEYYISLMADSDAEPDNVLPNRMIMQLYNSPLFTYLHAHLQRQIEHMFSKQRKQFIDTSAISPENQTDADIMRITRLYNPLKIRANKFKDAELQKALADSSNKLINRAKALIAGHRIVGGGRVEPVNPETATALSYTDRFLLLEVYRLFPDEYYWLEGRKQRQDADGNELTEEEAHFVHEQRRTLQAMARNSIEWILRTMINPDTGDVQNSALLMMFWDYMDVWLEDPTFAHGDIITEADRDVIRQMVERGNAASFLAWAKSWLNADNKVLLPSHVLALHQLANNHYQREILARGGQPISEREVADDLEALQSEQGNDDKITDLENELRDLQAKLDAERDNDIDTIVTGGKLKGSEKGAEYEIQYNELKAKIERAQEAYLDPARRTKFQTLINDFNTWSGATNTILNDPPHARVNITTARGTLGGGLDLTLSAVEGDIPLARMAVFRPGGGDIVETEPERSNYFKAVREAAQDRLSQYEGALDSVLQEYKNVRSTGPRLAPPLSVAETDEIDAHIQRYQREIEEFRRLRQRFETEINLIEKHGEKMDRLEEDIKRQVGGKLVKEQEKLQKKLQGLRSQHGLSDREKQILQDRYDLFVNLQSGADETLEKYNGGLSKRAREGSLYAADFAVLFSDQDRLPGEDRIDPAIEIYDVDPARVPDAEVRDFRTQFRGTIERFRQDFDQVLAEAVDEITRDSLNIPNPREISDTDRFMIWNRALDRVLSFDNLLPRLSAEGREGLDNYIDFYRQRDKRVNVGELIEGAIKGNKNRIIDLVSSKARAFGVRNANDPVFREFLAQYPRFHTTLALSDTYKQLQEKRDTFARERASINQQSQEVMNHIDQIFGRGEWEQIWKKIHPYIDRSRVNFPDARAEVAFQDQIRARLLGAVNDAGELIYDHPYLLSPGAGRERDGRWHGVVAGVDRVLDPYLRNDLGTDIRRRLAEDVLDMGLQARGKDEIAQVVRDQHDALVGGGNGRLPGKEMLAEAEVQLYPVRDAIKQETSNYEDRLKGIERTIKDSPDSGRVGLKALLLEGLEVLIPSLDEHLNSARSLLQHVMPDKPDFIHEYIENLRAELRLMRSRMLDYQAELDTIDASHPLFERIPAMFRQIDQGFNVTEGVWKENLDLLAKNQERIPKAVAFLKDELGLYGPEAEKTAKERYEKFRREYEARFNRYRENYGMVKNALNQDIKAVERGKMKREDFKAIHGTEPEEMQQLMFSLDDQYRDFRGVWDRYGSERFFDDWLDRYRDPRTRHGAVSDFLYWDSIKKLSTDLNEGSERFVTWKGQHQQQLKDVKQQRKPQYEFRMVSLKALWQMCKDSYELAGRRIERRIERDKAFLGNAVFGEKGMFGLGYEWERKRTEDEEKRVEEFKNQYKRKDMWEKRAMLYRLGKDPADKDEVRALVDLLVEDGTMRWDDPKFWKVLNLLNKRTGGPQIPETMMDKPMGEIKIALRKSCGAIWDDYVFKNWDDSIDGNHQKAVDAVKKEFADMEAIGGREKVLEQMLHKWRNGEEDETVSPERYEGLLKAAYDAGKMNGAPDPRWFYLIMGMTVKNKKTGMTLISRTMLDRLDEALLARIPYFDFFTDKQTHKKDGWIVASGTPGAEARPWNNKDLEIWGDFFGSDGRLGFNHTQNNTIMQKCNEFFYNNIVNSDNAQLRVDRKVREGFKEADHDDGEMWFGALKFQSMTQLFNRSSAGGDQITPDFAARICDGFGHMMRAKAAYIKNGDAKWKGNPNWEKMKQKALGQVGEAMRVGFGAIHTLQGNVHLSSRTEPTVLDQAHWKEGDRGRFNCVSSVERINGVMKDMLVMDNRDMSEYQEIWNYRGTRDDGDAYTERVKKDSYKRVDGKIKEILFGTEDVTGDSEDVAGSKMFEDLDLVERALMRYADREGGITISEDQEYTGSLYNVDSEGAYYNLEM